MTYASPTRFTRLACCAWVGLFLRVQAVLCEVELQKLSIGRWLNVIRNWCIRGQITTKLKSTQAALIRISHAFIICLESFCM